MLAERVPVMVALPEFVRPVMVMFPAPSTLNFVDELTCKSMKLPLKPEAGFEPRKVPVVFESWIVSGPSWNNCELVLAGGLPERRRARAPLLEDWM